MINTVFLGNSTSLQDKFKHLPNVNIQFCTNYKEVIRIYKKFSSNENDYCIVLFEKRNLNEDLTAITYLHQQLDKCYFILLTNAIDDHERQAYLSVGINDTLLTTASLTEITQKLDFINRKKEILFAKQNGKKQILQFKIPLWKRIFDVVFASTALIVLSPVFLLTAIAIRIESKGPILYKSKRVGSNYKIFDFLKFRSMFVDAEKRLKEYEQLNQYNNIEEGKQQNPINKSFMAEEEIMLISDDFIISEQEFNSKKHLQQENAFVKLENDPRITKVGRFIRKYSIDELPQLINILRGDMSVVGNRPLPLYEAELLTRDESIDRFIAPAGLTGLWQVEKRGGSGKLSAEERKQLDIKYGQTYSFMLDIKIILRTLSAFIQKENV